MKSILRPLVLAALLVFIITPIVRHSKQEEIPVRLTFTGLFAFIVFIFLYPCLAVSGPVQTGLTATGDSASTAYWNPAAMTLLDNKELEIQVLAGYAESEFEVTSTNIDGKRVTENDGSAVIPSIYYIHPINENWRMGISINARLGFGADFSDNWAGRYFIDEWALGFVGCDPVIAYRVNEKLSVGGGLSINYSAYHTESAVKNIDPSYGDGRMELDASDVGLGFTLSALYELSKKTRFGIVYRSEIDPEVEGDPEFDNLDSTRTSMLASSNILGKDVKIDLVSPQKVQIGFFHKFENNIDVMADLLWIDFDQFGFKQISLGDASLQLDRTEYQDIFACTVGIGYPVNDKWALNSGVLYASKGVKDENRSFFLRLDRIIGIGIGTTYTLNQYKRIGINLNYYDLGEAPVETKNLPLVGSLTGEYSKNHAIAIELFYQWELGG
jgi:long-chain fatty acid transport protein